MLRKFISGILIFIILFSVSFSTLLNLCPNESYGFDVRGEAQDPPPPPPPPPPPAPEPEPAPVIPTPEPEPEPDPPDPPDVPDEPDNPDPEPTEPEPPCTCPTGVFSMSFPTRVEGVVFEDFIRPTLIDDGSILGTHHITNNYVHDSDEPTVSGITVSFKKLNKVLNNSGFDRLPESNPYSVSYLDANPTPDEIVTSPNGRFTFTTPGAYNVQFVYGGKTDSGYTTSNSDYALNKDVLKYNGQDYYMVTNTNHESTDWLRRIKEMKKSYTEIYLLIDYSVSMSSTDRLGIVTAAAKDFVNELFENAQGTVAVGIIAFAGKTALMTFPSEVKSDVIGAINEVSHPSRTYYKGYGTNIGLAVQKANSSYLSEDSTHVMVLFSDGCPTAHDAVQPPLYNNDSDEVMIDKVNRIADKTRDNLKTIVNDDVTLISILNRNIDDMERSFVERAFKDGDGFIGTFYNVDYDNLDAVRESLLHDTLELVTEEQHGLVDYQFEKEPVGNDDPVRRKTVNNNYKELYYNNLNVFEVSDKLTGAQTDVNVVSKFMNYDAYMNERLSDSQKQNLYMDFFNTSNPNSTVKAFIDNSWVNTESKRVKIYEVVENSSVFDGYDTIYSTSSCSVDCPRHGSVSAVSLQDNSGPDLTNGSATGVYAYVSLTAAAPIVMDAALVKRDEFKLELEKRITGVKLTLSDGSVLYNQASKTNNVTVLYNDGHDESMPHADAMKKLYNQQLLKWNNRDDDSFEIPADQAIKDIKYDTIKEISIGMPEGACLIADSLVLQGATIEVEYTFVIQNHSENGTFSNQIGLVDYFDNGLTYRPDSKLLSEDGTNADYGWKILTKDELIDRHFINDDVRNNFSGDCVYVNYNEKEYMRAEGISDVGAITCDPAKTKYVNPVIGNNQETYIKVVVSRVLSPEILEDFNYVNHSEILKYGDNDCRRINFIETHGTTPVYRYAISGNYIPIKGFDAAFTHVNEIDTGLSHAITIIPPTGGTMTRNNVNYYEMFTTMVSKLVKVFTKF